MKKYFLLPCIMLQYLKKFKPTAAHSVFAKVLQTVYSKTKLMLIPAWHKTNFIIM